MLFKKIIFKTTFQRIFKNFLTIFSMFLCIVFFLSLAFFFTSCTYQPITITGQVFLEVPSTFADDWFDYQNGYQHITIRSGNVVKKTDKDGRFSFQTFALKGNVLFEFSRTNYKTAHINVTISESVNVESFFATELTIGKQTPQPEASIQLTTSKEKVSKYDNKENSKDPRTLGVDARSNEIPTLSRFEGEIGLLLVHSNQNVFEYVPLK